MSLSYLSYNKIIELNNIWQGNEMISRILQVVIVSMICVFSSLAIATEAQFKQVQLKQAIVGIWSHDLENTNYSLVIEFHDNGSFDLLMYDRSNIAVFDMAVGNYYLKDNKLHTMLYSANGTLNHLQLYKEIQMNVLTIDQAGLKISDNGQELLYRLVSQKEQFTIDDYI
jgi:hypothetical protein